MADDKKVNESEAVDNKPDEPKKPDRDNTGETHSFKINGVKIESPHEKPTALDILNLAKKKGAIPGKPEDYILQGKETQYKSDDSVNLGEDNEFISIPNTSTHVA